jgi:hypothetical protein
MCCPAKTSGLSRASTDTFHQRAGEDGKAVVGAYFLHNVVVHLPVRRSALRVDRPKSPDCEADAHTRGELGGEKRVPDTLLCGW